MKKIIITSILLAMTIFSFGGYDCLKVSADKNNMSDSDDVSSALNFEYGSFSISADVKVYKADNTAVNAYASASAYTVAENKGVSSALSSTGEMNHGYSIGYTYGLGYALSVTVGVATNTTPNTATAEAVISW